MKKVILFFLLITYSFCNNDLEKLKWGASHEEVLKYCSQNKYYTFSDNDFFSYHFLGPNIYFEDEKLDVLIILLYKGKFERWFGVNKVSKENGVYIYSKYKNKYMGEEVIIDNKKLYSYTYEEGKNNGSISIELTEYENYSSISYAFSYVTK